MASACRLIVPGVFVPPSSYKAVVLAVRLLYTVLYTKERPTGVFAMFLFRKFIILKNNVCLWNVLVTHSSQYQKKYCKRGSHLVKQYFGNSSFFGLLGITTCTELRL